MLRAIKPVPYHALGRCLPSPSPQHNWFVWWTTLGVWLTRMDSMYRLHKSGRHVVDQLWTFFCSWQKLSFICVRCKCTQNAYGLYGPASQCAPFALLRPLHWELLLVRRSPFQSGDNRTKRRQETTSSILLEKWNHINVYALGACWLFRVVYHVRKVALLPWPSLSQG